MQRNKDYYIHPDRIVELIKTIYIDTPEGKEKKEVSIILDEDTIIQINQELSELPMSDDKEYEDTFNSNGAEIQKRALAMGSNYPF